MEVRLRTKVNDGTVVQKGQSGGGGMWKMELHNGGYGVCVFKGTTASVGMSSDYKLSDGQWHVVRCERTSTTSAMYVDGVLQTSRRVTTGDIQNTWSWRSAASPVAPLRACSATTTAVTWTT